MRPRTVLIAVFAAFSNGLLVVAAARPELALVALAGAFALNVVVIVAALGPWGARRDGSTTEATAQVATPGTVTTLRRRADDHRERRKSDREPWAEAREGVVNPVFVKTSDDLRLDGLWYTAAARGGTPGVDAVICVHGNGDDNHRSSVFDSITDHFVAAGTPCLRIDTRGKGTISNFSTSTGNRKVGSAFETVADCLLDLDAWIRWTERQGFRRVMLVGHSLGALKCLYYASQRPAAVVRVVAISPPRLSHSYVASSSIGEGFMVYLEQARAMAASGRAEDLLEVRVPFKYVTSAAAYLDKYGSEEKYLLTKFLDDVAVPALILIGSEEGERLVIFERWFKDLAAATAASDSIRVVEVSGANHYYTGCREAVVGHVAAWIGGTELRIAPAPELKTA